MTDFSPPIQQLLEHIRGNVQRRESFDALIQMHSTEATRALLDLQADYRVPPFYAEIIHELGRRDAVDPMTYIRDILRAESGPANLESHQITILSLLEKYARHPETIPLIEHVLRHNDNRIILRQAVFTLGQIGSDEAVYVLSLLMYEHPSDRVRHDALNVLGSTRNPTAVAVLLNFLERDHPLSDGEIPSDCVNAMQGLLRLWQADTQPFDVQRWLEILTHWLYRDRSDYSSAEYHLQATRLPEATDILETWQQWRANQQDDAADAPIFR